MSTDTRFQESRNALGFIEASPKPSVEELRAHYQQKYYQNPAGPYSHQYPPEELEYFNNIAKVARATAQAFDLTETLLDVGCGEGFFSAAFANFGWGVKCCDFADFALRKHNPHLLPRFRPGDLYDSIRSYSQETLTFGLVNLQNVLEHVIDPVAVLLDLRKLLIPGNSALRIRVPNDYSEFQLKLVEAGHTTSTWFAPPEHLSYFNNDGLKSILSHCGYKLLSLQADFPIELFLANPHSNYWKNRALGKGAHSTRVFCENFLINKDVDAYIAYSAAAGELGFGRELIAYATPV